MLVVAPPNQSTVIGTAELALKYLQEKNYDLVEIVIKNIIRDLKCPDFNKDHYEETTYRETLIHND